MDSGNDELVEILLKKSRAGEPEAVGVCVFDSLEPELLEKKNQEPLGKSQEQEPAPQPYVKINSTRKLYFSYSSLGKIVSFYG